MELKDYLEQHPELEELSEEELAIHLARAEAQAEAAYESIREEE